MQRREFLVAAVLPSAVAACVGTEIPPNYPHVVLNASTLSRYPDDVGSVTTILESDGFRDRDVVLELVAGWCQPCRLQKPRMDAALASLADRGTRIARLTIYYEERNRSQGGYRNTFNSVTKSKKFPEVQVWRDAQPLPSFLVGSRSRAEIDEFLRTNIAGSVAASA